MLLLPRVLAPSLEEQKSLNVSACGEKAGQGKNWEGKGRGTEVLKNSPGCVAQLVVVLSHAPKGCMFDSQSGTHLGASLIRKLRIKLGVCLGGN